MPRRRVITTRRNAVLGALALAATAVVLFFGFTKDIPFTHGFLLKAQFESANSIRPDSPVRIAGVEVGKVKSVEGVEGSNAALLTMEIDDRALPLRADATAKIRPRIFLEGNFFVDLKPGSPTAPQLSSGDTIAITQTATPVQLDEVLTALQSDSREDLKVLLDGLDAAFDSSASASFNRALDDIPAAERSTAQVLEALLGTEPARDVERLIRGTVSTADELGRSESELEGLITNLNVATATLAGSQANLRASIRELAPTLAAANSAFSALNAAFPPTRAFAREIRPGVRETPATIDAALPWIEQARELVGSDELGGVAERLAPASADLARLLDRAMALLPQADLAARCARDVVLPAGNLVINDEFTTGEENYKEFFYALVGIAGEGQNTDGNGMYVRFQTGGGAQRVALGDGLFGNNVQAPLGNRPAMPSRRPAYRPDEPCYQQPLPDVNGPAAAKSAPTGTTTAQAQAASLDAVRRKLNPFATREDAE